jgi:hypothetical protein
VINSSFNENNRTPALKFISSTPRLKQICLARSTSTFFVNIPEAVVRGRQSLYKFSILIASLVITDMIHQAPSALAAETATRLFFDLSSMGDDDASDDHRLDRSLSS